MVELELGPRFSAIVSLCTLLKTDSRNGFRNALMHVWGVKDVNSKIIPTWSESWLHISLLLR